MPENVDGIRYLSRDDLILINRIIIEQTTPEERSGVLLPNALESAQQRPGVIRCYEQTEDMMYLAAVLFASIAQFHPFHNANKRTAFASCRMFLMLNGAYLDAPANETVCIALDTVEGSLTEAQIASWLASHSHSADPATAIWSSADNLLPSDHQ